MKERWFVFDSVIHGLIYVKALSASKARYRVYKAEREAGYVIRFQDIRILRARVEPSSGAKVIS